MAIPLSVINDIFLIIVVIVSFLYLFKQLYKELVAHKIIKVMYIAILVLLVLDVLIHFSEENQLRPVEEFFLTINTSMSPLIGFLWLLFIREITKFKVKPIYVLIVATVLIIINVILSILTFTGVGEFYYDYSSGSAEIGRFFIVFALITMIPYFLATIMLILQWKVMRKRRRPVVFLIVSFFPLLGLFTQMVAVDYTISLSSIVVTFVIVCLDMQHQFAVTDYMTGLYNRRRLSQKLGERIRRMNQDQMFAGYMIDLNNFKQMNDEFGHAYGDRILQDFSQILLNVIDGTDIVSRYGGDEFVIIRDIKEPQELNQFRAKLFAAVDVYNKKDDIKHQIDLSVGADIYLKRSDYTAEHFLEIIDEKMYRHKNQSKNPM